MPCEVRVMDSSTLNDGSSQNSNETDPTVINEESLLVQQFTKNGMQSLMELIKASNNLPNEKWDFYTTFPSFNKMVGSESQKILDLLSSVLQHQQIKGNIFRRDNEEKYEMVIEANDGILERVDCNLDELQGLKKNPEPVVGKIKAIDRRGRYAPYKHNDINAPVNIMEQNKFRTLITTRLNVRPQIKFKDKIDNRNIPFEPRIKEKPNALKPLSILVEKIDERGESFSHPYEYELDLFKPPEDQLKICDPQTPKTVDETPLIYVNNLDTLNTMIDHLKNHREIAVDLEHHSYRSFQGFTCLLQISTREQDFIVDALDLRHELYRLNEFFTNPKVVKVFHGSELDVEWLQRDLCLYVVNMFDTHQAARVLDFPRLSLAHLLKVFCNVDCNKQFQLYDWRTRPLSEAAIKYAREDTHYLLYIYDKMKNLLIEKCQNKSNLLENVINMSTDLCRRKFWKPILTESSYMEFYRRSRKMFDNKQMYALKHLYEWRDKKARDEDESVMYVLPNHMLLNIAESLPREVQGVSALCNPVPPLVKQYEREIHQIIFKAREQSLVKPVLEGEALNQSLKEVQPNWVPVNVDSKLYCPHDLSHNDDFRENLPTLLEKKINLLSIGTMKNNKFATNSSVIDVIHNNDQGDRSEWSADLLRGKERQWKFVSPYQRYQKVMAFVNSEENKATESEEKVDDGPSPAKIPRLDGSSESNAQETTENLENDIKEPKQNDDDMKSDRCETKNNSTEMIASPPITESAKKKRKKKKKKFDSEMSTCEEVEESSVQSSNDNETIVVNDPVIPNLRNHEDDVSSTDVVPDVNKQQSDTSTKPTKSNERKKKLNNVDPKDKDESDNTDKKRAKSKDDFQPYNYSDADFSRFQSSTKQQSKHGPKKLPNTPKGRRTPWLGNKKNSIKKTIGSIGK